MSITTVAILTGIAIYIVGFLAGYFSAKDKHDFDK